MEEGRAERRRSWVRRVCAWVFVLAVLVGIGAVGGYFGVGKWYVSVRAIPIRPVTAGSFFYWEIGGQAAREESYIALQMKTLKSDRVRKMAMNSEGWRREGRRAMRYSDDLFAQHLTISHRPTTDIISISFTDSDPALARIAVQELIAAYFEVYEDSGSAGMRTRMKLLVERQRELTEKIRKVEKEISELTLGKKDDLATRASEEKLLARRDLEEVTAIIELESVEAPTPTSERQVSMVEPEPPTLMLQEPQVRGAKMGAGVGFLVGLGVIGVAGARRRRVVGADFER